MTSPKYVSDLSDKWFFLRSAHASIQILPALQDLAYSLNSNNALSVFVPEQWTGITGIPPIHLRLSDQLPLCLGPKVMRLCAAGPRSLRTLVQVTLECVLQTFRR